MANAEVRMRPFRLARGTTWRIQRLAFSPYVRPCGARPPRRFVAVLAVVAPDALAAGHSLRFFGAGAGDVDRVKIRIDDPLKTPPGAAADVGGTDFTLEFWLMASAAQNTAPPVTCGANQAWTSGNVVVDRDRFGADRKFGVSIAGGKVVFGVSGDATGDLTLCSLSSVLDSAWHHVAVERRRSDGNLWLFVDGNLEAQAIGPGGDVSYPDATGGANANDPYLVLGAEKYDTGHPVFRLAGRAADLDQAPLCRQFFAAARAVRRRPLHGRALPLRRGRRSDAVRRVRRRARTESRTHQARRRRQRPRVDAGQPVQRRRPRQQRDNRVRAVRVGIRVAGRSRQRGRRLRSPLRGPAGWLSSGSFATASSWHPPSSTSRRRS